MGEIRIDLKSVAAFVLVSTLIGALLLMASPPPSADAASCPTATSSISKLKNISCKQARRVARIVVRISGEYPECRGEVAKGRGWVARGLPMPGSGKVITARFVKGKKSFLLSGGGVC